MKLSLLLVTILLLSTGCSTLKDKVLQEKPREERSPLVAIAPHELSPEERQELVEEVGGNYVYGQGVGQTMLNIGSIALFPPFAVYLLGNSILEYSGYEPLEISSALPAEGKRSWDQVYEQVTAGPGKVIAAVAGEEYRSKEIAREKLSRFTKQEVLVTEEMSKKIVDGPVSPQFYTELAVAESTEEGMK